MPKPYAQYDLENQRRPNLTHSMIWRPRGVQTLRTICFGEPEAPKPYAQSGLDTQRRPNLTHSIICITRMRPNLTRSIIRTTSGAQTLRSVSFGDSKPYAQYNLETERRLNVTHSKIWRRRVVQICIIKGGGRHGPPV